ncbi:MAG TPA: hypothetical protein VGF14_03265 [Alphaproteobacteria bacterium]
MQFKKEKMILNTKEIVTAGAVAALALFATVAQLTKSHSQSKKIQSLEQEKATLAANQLPPSVEQNEWEDLRQGRANAETIASEKGAHAKVHTITTADGQEIPIVQIFKDTSWVKGNGETDRAIISVGKYIIK